jgi:hypothetical protein
VEVLRLGLEGGRGPLRTVALLHLFFYSVCFLMSRRAQLRRRLRLDASKREDGYQD